ncbi:MAG: hypothetical protein ACKVTZ_19250 [Bacteroidia bacterium]
MKSYFIFTFCLFCLANIFAQNRQNLDIKQITPVTIRLDAVYDNLPISAFAEISGGMWFEWEALLYIHNLRYARKLIRLPLPIILSGVPSEIVHEFKEKQHKKVTLPIMKYQSNQNPIF